MKKLMLQIEIPPNVLSRLIKLGDKFKSIDTMIELILTTYIIKKEEENQE